VPFDGATRYDGPSLFPDATHGVSYDVEARAMTDARIDATTDARGDATTDARVDANRALWNEWTGVHEASAFYDLAAFKAGRDTLRPLEVAELGDVSGKTLLHLMCHFGQDTLCWARRGARVTGADLSDKAIDLARSLAAELALEARFLAGDIYDLPAALDERYEIVFTSWGVLTWLSDLPRWGRLVADFLAPGGSFYLAEIHPFAMVLDVRDDGALVFDYSYLSEGAAGRYESDTSYADPTTVCANTVSYQWDHTLGEVVCALIDAGLVIEFLHEWPFSVYQRWPSMVEEKDGWWYLPECRDVPLSFSLRAHKPR
jgi:SAM-dependent methyltransferase